MSIGTIKVGDQLDYHQRQIAQGRDDYYAGAGEAPGKWAGEMAGELGAGGTITAEGHQALLAGVDPVTGERLAQRGPNTKVVGYDVTFSAPKSVSVLYAVAGEEVSRALVEAHDEAVAAGFAYLEREACVVRRGRGGQDDEPADGFLAASYRHRMSRLEDPQLHTHMVVANAARGTDGRWTALHGRALYRHAKAAGTAYQAHLRAAVRERLPWVEWGPVVKGAADIEGVGAEVLRPFSQRRAEIEAVLASQEAAGQLRRGDTKGAGERAALTTRTGKDASIQTIPWRERQQIRGAEYGLGRDELAALTARAPREVDPVDRTAVAERLSGPEGLTGQRNTFGAKDAVIEWASAHRQGAKVDELERLTAGYLAGGGVRSVADRDRLHTTEDLLARERQVVDGAVARQQEGAGLVDGQLTRRTLYATGRTLNGEQRAALEALTTSGRGVDPVEALAGTGKTYLAGALHDVYTAAGYRVLGAAPTGRAATELREQAGIAQSRTLTRLAGELGDYGGFGTSPTVLILDEVGMASTREVASVAAAAQTAGVKVIAIGDSGQLSSVAAGGTLGALTRRIGSAELTQVMRQLDPAERARLAEVHDGQPDRYLAHKAARDELQVNSSAAGAEAAALVAWRDAQAQGQWGDAVLVARDNDTRDRLNEAARAIAREDGRLGPDSELGGRQLAPGDRVITRRNDDFHAVDNGTRATVRAIDEQTRALVIESDAGGVHELPEHYVRDHVEHAYALTGHGTQGATVRWAGVVGATDDFSQNWGYTALSRAREPTRVFVHEQLPGHLADRQADRADIAPAETRDPAPAVDRLASRLRVRDDELLALEQIDLGPPALPDNAPPLAPTVAPDATRAERLWADLDAIEARLSALPISDLEALDSARERRVAAEQAVEQAGAALAAAELADSTGGRFTRRRVDPAGLAAAELGVDQARTDLAHARVDEERLAVGVPDRGAIEAEHAPLHDRAQRIRDQLGDLRDDQIARALERPGGHLTRELGDRPPPGGRRIAWDRAAQAVERYRFDHRETGPDILGPDPAKQRDQPATRDNQTSARERQQRQRVQRDLERAQRALGRNQARDRGLSR